MKRDRSKDFDKNNFGGNREKALRRDNYCCQKCWMTNKEHIKKYGRRITVDHKDRNRANNAMNNLETLCLGCHGRKDTRLRPVLQFTLDGKFVKKYPSTIDASRAMKCTPQNIRANISGYSAVARGHIWKFADSGSGSRKKTLSAKGVLWKN